MTTRKVPSVYPTISAAVATAKTGDIILIAGSYGGNETVDVAVDGLTVTAGAGVPGVVLTLAPGVRTLTLSGKTQIAVNGNGRGNVLADTARGRNVLNGGGGGDTINAYGNDIVDGGVGNDMIVAWADKFTALDGGDGDDLFVIHGRIGAVDGGAGIDTIRGSALRRLTFSNIEILDAYGSRRLDVTIGQLASVVAVTDSKVPAGVPLWLRLSGAGGTIDFSRLVSGQRSVMIDDVGLKSGVDFTGTAWNDDLRGSRYGDTLSGGAGDDWIGGGTGINILDGGDGNDTLSSSGRDTIHGGAGNDSIFETAQAFTLLDGGDGDDLFYVSGGKGVVDGGAGIDTVRDGGLYGLTLANIEIVDAYGDGGFDATVGQLASIATITDSLAPADGLLFIALKGRGGTLDLPQHLVGEQSVNLYDNGLLSRIDITGTSHDDFLGGSRFADTLSGGSDDDTIDGGLGDDVLVGGAGNDTVAYSSMAGGVTVSLAVGGRQNTGSAGKDTLDGFENLTGSVYADVLTGDAHDNVLNGGRGIDTLTGGAGNDRFVFDSFLAAYNVATITDFTAGGDSIALSLGIFARAGTAPGTLAARAFFVGAAAHDASDRIIYDSATGNLMYDSDGTGGNAAVTFARVGPNLHLTNGDFRLFRSY